MPDVTLDWIWPFVRGDLPAAEFEHWVYRTPELEGLLGADLHLDLLSANYRDPEDMGQLREKLEKYVQPVSKTACMCHTLSNTCIVHMGEHSHVFATLTETAERGSPYWWLHLHECSACGQAWLVGSEERQNDLYCLRRLTAEQSHAIQTSGRWPPDFDDYETLLRIGRDGGAAVRWFDPVNDSSLPATITDVARARPGIKLSELVDLLNVGPEVVRAILGGLDAADRDRINDDV